MSFHISLKAWLRTKLLVMKSSSDSKASLRTKLINLDLPPLSIVQVLIEVDVVTAALKLRDWLADDSAYLNSCARTCAL